MKAQITKLCTDHKFEVGIYYKVNADKLEGGDYFVSNPGLEAFVTESKKVPSVKGKGMRGRVFASEKYEWDENVQKMDVKDYARKDLAVKGGLMACFCVAVKTGGKVTGVMEFYKKTAVKEEKPVVDAICKEVQK